MNTETGSYILIDTYYPSIPVEGAKFGTLYAATLAADRRNSATGQPDRYRVKRTHSDPSYAESVFRSIGAL